MLRAQVYEDVKAAMKAQDHATLDVVRFLWSEIKRIEIDAKHELSDDEVIDLFRKEIKRRNDAINQMKTAHRPDIIAHEEAQLNIISRYVPALMSEADIAEEVDRVIAAGHKDFGSVMREVMIQLRGKADGGTVLSIVKQKLNQ